jgi:3-deoxy-D-manno-oct-2-ulosonic acid (Kdo) hydroxylase
LSRLTTLDHASWTDDPWADNPAPGALDLVKHLERGDVLFFPRLRFQIRADEASLFSPAILSTAKNASFDPATGRVGGARVSGPDLERLRALMSRFSTAAAGFAGLMLPHYRGRLVRARSSFRPAEIAGRASSWRKDDTRLHVDSFPASPVQGRRILRLFTNVNPDGRPRSWRVGDSFAALAARFSPSLRPPWPGHGALLEALRVTKSRRTAYDALMLQLHDRMKCINTTRRRPLSIFPPAPPGWRSPTRSVTPPRRDSISSNRRFCCRSTQCSTQALRRCGFSNGSSGARWFRQRQP